jgi:transcriptional regulator with XRE-family HTH domain
MSEEFATKLIALRVEKDLTQQQLAHAVGISSSQISRYESGLAMPRKTVMLKLAKALGVATEDLKGAKPAAGQGLRLFEGFSSRLLDARQNASVSIKTLSLEAGIEEVALRQLERGEAAPSPEDLISLSRALGVPVKALVGSEDEDDVMVLRVAYEDSERVDLVPVTPRSYASLVQLGEQLGLSTSEALELLMKKLGDVAGTPNHASRAFMEIVAGMKKTR